LNGDVSIETVGYDPKNLQLNEARGYLALELCRAAGLPAYFASAEPNSFTYSNALSERRSLIDYSLRPLMTAIEQRISLSDFTPLGQEVKFNLDDFLRGNPLERAQVYEILNRIGAMSIEEIREEEDLLL
jgi:HK97 family phage portal protein